MPTPSVHARYKLQQHNGTAPVDWDTDTIKVMLVDATVAPNVTTQQFIDDVSANEVSGAGYTAGGATIAGASIALDGSTVKMAHNDVTWSQDDAGFSDARYAYWCKDTGTPATSVIIMSMDLGSAKGNVSGNLTLDADATTGVLQV